MSVYEYSSESNTQENKLRGMLEYCLLNGSSHGKIPKTKLFKLIYLSDFTSYYSTGKSISGLEYKNREYGPVPDVLFFLVDKMVESGDIVIEDGSLASFHKLAIEPKYLKNLTEGEEKILSEVCDYWSKKSTGEIVDLTHKQRPWALTKEDEVVPYELILQENHPFKPPSDIC